MIEFNETTSNEDLLILLHEKAQLKEIKSLIHQVCRDFQLLKLWYFLRDTVAINNTRDAVTITDDKY
jgi:hypothetical protein